MSRALAMREAQELRASLLDHGVRQVSIELQQGRPGTPHDRWYAPTFLTAMSHHIVSRRSMGITPGLALVKRGRPGLPGPLANLYGGFDQQSRILCMGWANHPGRGGPLVIRGRIIPGDNGRPYLMGTEFEGGLSEADWTDGFREYMGRHNSGVLDYLGASPQDHLEHSTWAPARKIDRLGYTTASGRAEVVRWFNATVGDDMTPDQARTLDAIAGTVSKMRSVVREELQDEVTHREYLDFVPDLEGVRRPMTLPAAVFSARRDAHHARRDSAIARRLAEEQARTTGPLDEETIDTISRRVAEEVSRLDADDVVGELGRRLSNDVGPS